MMPCRAALKVKTTCPKCQRPMSIKSLKYQHQCGRSWDVAVRAAEEERKAHEAVQARTPAPEARVAETTRARYANLVAQIA